MKLPFVSRKRYEEQQATINYWRIRSKFTLQIPYLDGDGIGMVQVYCKNEEQADLIRKKLSKPTKETK